MNHLSSTLVLCDLDHLLLGADGNLTQVVRDVLQLFVRRGGRFTVFSQRTPRAVRSILGSVRLSAPALVCGGAMAYHFADGTCQPLCTFAGQDADLFARLPVAEGVGIALQMTDGRSAAGAAVSGQQGSAHDLAAGKISGRPHSGAAGRACRNGYADPDPQNRLRP